MKKYEIMYILNAELKDDARKSEMSKLHAVLESNGGKVDNVNEELGLRDLAYPINDHKKGYYVVVTTTTDAANLNEFSRLVRINKNVIRHLVTVIKK